MVDVGESTLKRFTTESLLNNEQQLHGNVTAMADTHQAEVRQARAQQ